MPGERRGVCDKNACVKRTTYGGVPSAFRMKCQKERTEKDSKNYSGGRKEKQNNNFLPRQCDKENRKFEVRVGLTHMSKVALFRRRCTLEDRIRSSYEKLDFNN